jgi:hypothetical protein
VVKAAGYIGLVILQIGLLSVAAPARSAQPKEQHQHKTASSTHSRAKDSTQWAADPLHGWIPAETRHDEKEKKSATKQRQQTKPNDRTNRFQSNQLKEKQK